MFDFKNPKESKIKIRTCGIKISLSCFDNKIYILNNGYDRLALGYDSESKVVLIII